VGFYVIWPLTIRVRGAATSLSPFDTVFNFFCRLKSYGALRGFSMRWFPRGCVNFESSEPTAIADALVSVGGVAAYKQLGPCKWSFTSYGGA